MKKILPLSSKLSIEVGTIHFIGIGGIGMSGIAEVLHNLGFTVQGSDSTQSYNTERLESKGIKIMIGQDPKNIEGANVVVKSTAVKDDNPEIIAAKELHIPIVRRAEMLAELMRFKLSIAIAGTHGKTTTTSMIANLLDTAKFDPTVINGGIINAYGTNAYLGKSEWMVVEADESDGTFNKIPASVAVVTNIEPEHLDFYGNFDEVKKAFKNFISNIPFYGFGVMCLDHPEVQQLVGQINDRRVITYGISAQADVRAENIRTENSVTVFDVAIDGHKIKDIKLPMPGHHNILNALAAIAVGHELKISDDVIKLAFSKFEGVKRRFTKVGEVNGITIIDDYGHHPTEISATLQAARQVCSSCKVVAVVQPHRFTRVRDLFNEFATCFNNADKVIVLDIYTAGEKPIEGIDKEHLVEAIKKHGHRDAVIASAEELPQLISEYAKSGDYVICLGAGSITYMAAKLPEQLQKLNGKVA